MEYTTPQFIDSIANLLWPIITLICIIIVSPKLVKILNEARELKLKIGDIEVSTLREVNILLVEPINIELSQSIRSLNVEHIETFRRIFIQIERNKKEFVLKDFKRESDFHNILRTLRDVNFIRPIGGGRWTEGNKIEIKNFGRLAANVKKSELGL